MLSEQIKEFAAAGTVLVTLVAGYTGLQKDVAYTTEAVAVEHGKNAEQDTKLKEQEIVSARVDERTRLMKEQLDRIEANQMRGKK